MLYLHTLSSFGELLTSTDPDAQEAKSVCISLVANLRCPSVSFDHWKRRGNEVIWLAADRSETLDGSYTGKNIQRRLIE